MKARDILPLTRKLWVSAKDKLSSLGIATNKVRVDIDKINVIDGTVDFGGELQDGVLRLSKGVIGGEIPIKGVVFRECFKSLFPCDFLCQESIDDMANEFARQALTPQERGIWERLWSESRGERKIDGVIVYNPSESFVALEGLIGLSGFASIVKDLSNIQRYGIDLTFNDYLRYFETRMRRFSVSLSKTELHIANQFVRDANVSIEDIAASLSLTPQWVSTKISDLQKRHILRRFESVRFSRVGIRIFHLLLGSESLGEESRRYLAHCPFLYGTRNVLSGHWNLHATMAIPDNHKSIRALREFIEVCKQRGFAVMDTEVVSSGKSFSFDFYEHETGEWRIPWDLERIQLRNVFSQNLASAFPRIDEPRPRARRFFDELDIRIIDQVWKRNTSVAGIRKALGVGQIRVADKVKQLRNQGILENTWEVHNIGLNEEAFVMARDDRMGRAIAAWALRLPKAIVSFDVDSSLMMISSLPLGGGYGLTWSLDYLSDEITTGLLGPPVYGNWRFPVDLWSDDEQRWLYPHETIAEWFESIR